MRVRLITIILAPLMLNGCAQADKYEARDERISRALEGNAQGSGSTPAWLVKVSSIAPDDRTAVFYGYADNFQACSEFAEEMNESGRQVEYACALMVD